MPRLLATDDADLTPASELHGRERVVVVLAVGAVAITSLLAAVMHIPQERSAQAPRLALGGTTVPPSNRSGQG